MADARFLEDGNQAMAGHTWGSAPHPWKARSYPRAYSPTNRALSPGGKGAMSSCVADTGMTTPAPDGTSVRGRSAVSSSTD